MHRDDVDAYLARLGVAAEPPSPQALARLHRAHVERITYENLWIHLDQLWTVDTGAAVRRIAHERRGGYCFHLNGAFAALLEALGYSVTRHVSGIHGPGGPHPDELKNHVALFVDGLPDERSPDGRWYVDAGLGDSLYEPMPLQAGTCVQGPIAFTLEPTEGGWHLGVGKGTSIGGGVILAPAVTIDTFTQRHEQLRDGAGSPFRRTVTAQRRYAAGTAVLRGLVFTRFEGGEPTVVQLGDRASWLALLADEFGLHLDVPAENLERLWRRVGETHERWLRERAAASG